MKNTFERLGIPEQERKFLAGVEAQFDSEAAYSRMKDDLEEKGVIFVGSTDGLKDHPEIFKKWFGKVIPTSDNKFSALNSAVFSGGSFIYIPPGVKLGATASSLFPYQCRKLRAIRTDSDHRGRRIGSHLHGGLYRT